MSVFSSKAKTSCILLMLLILSCPVARAGKPDVSLKLDPAQSEWFRDAKFGLFLHWGLYSVLEGSYDGRTLPDQHSPHGNSWYAEWIKADLEIPDDRYNALVSAFNPVAYDADQWVREACNAGMKYIVITAKHHDGFALWHSKVSDFDISRSPYHKDLIAQLVKACKKYGVKYGFYYSHWQDWEHPGGAVPRWMPTRPDDEFETYWQEKCLPQVKELICKFDPDLLWFDTWGRDTHITAARRDELIRLVRTYSDKCLINGRICYEDPGDDIDFLEMMDNSYPKQFLSRPWQTPATMQHSWGWHAQDYNWKSADEMLRYLVQNCSRGGNYLLNVGPKADGTFPAPATRRLREMGAWLSVNGEAVYGTRRVDMDAPDGIFLTQKDGRLYVFVTDKMAEATLPVRLSEAEVLESSRPITVRRDAGQSTLMLPDDLFRDSSILVIQARMD